ncbi:MAG TPA: PAS domain S-box protein [Azospirillum sp.]|nr:PAS domain S-box protein [Azospirillum sp.]
MTRWTPNLLRPLSRPYRVRTWLILLVVACVLPLVLFSAILLIHDATVQTGQAEGLVGDRARQLAEDIDREVARVIAAGEVLATDASLSSGDLVAFHERAVKVRDTLGTNVVLRDRSGQHLVNTRVPWGTVLPHNPPFEVDRRVLETRRPQISGSVTGIVTKAPLLLVIVPVVGEGEVRFFLSLTIPHERVQTIIASKRLPPGWGAGVADADGVLIARSAKADELVGSPLPRLVWDRYRNAPDRVHRTIDLDGNAALQAYSRSQSSGWVVSVSVPEALVTGPSRQVFRLFVGGGLVLFLIGIVSAVAVGRRLTQPIAHLAEAAAALGAGRPAPLQAERVVEIDAMGAALQDAAKLIRHREAALLDSETRYRAIVETAVDPLVVIDEGGVIRAFNPAAERVFGYRADDAIGRNVRMLMPEPYRSAHDGYLVNFRRTGERKVIGIGREVMGRREDGSVFPVELTVAEWEAGGCLYFTGMMRDVTARRRAEDALRASKAEAERANVAKSKFLAAASHDLRQPVQAMVLFQAALTERLGGHPASHLLDSMGQVLGGLHTLLDSLLDVSKLDAGPNTPST